MGQLLFRKCFWPAIVGGTKRTTVRRWNRPRLKAGQRAFAPGLGWLKIGAVDVVELGAFTDADAQADGFTTLGEMLAALEEIYPDARADGKQWFRIEFQFEAPAVVAPVTGAGAQIGNAQSESAAAVREIPVAPVQGELF